MIVHAEECLNRSSTNILSLIEKGDLLVCRVQGTIAFYPFFSRVMPPWDAGEVSEWEIIEDLLRNQREGA